MFSSSAFSQSAFSPLAFLFDSVTPEPESQPSGNMGGGIGKTYYAGPKEQVKPKRRDDDDVMFLLQ